MAFAGAFFTVSSHRFPATLVSSTNGAAEGLHRNGAPGYLEGPKGRAQQQAVG